VDDFWERLGVGMPHSVVIGVDSTKTNFAPEIVQDNAFADRKSIFLDLPSEENLSPAPRQSHV
jgi:hypothetical protein